MPQTATSEPEAHPHVRTAPRPVHRLRTKLITILVTMLGIACLMIGVSSYWAISSSLMDRAYSQLDEAAHRAVKPLDAGDKPLTPNGVWK